MTDQVEPAARYEVTTEFDAPVCTECGALIDPTRATRHAQWHDVIRAGERWASAHLENLISRVYELEVGDDDDLPSGGGMALLPWMNEAELGLLYEALHLLGNEAQDDDHGPDVEVREKVATINSLKTAVAEARMTARTSHGLHEPAPSDKPWFEPQLFDGADSLYQPEADREVLDQHGD